MLPRISRRSERWRSVLALRKAPDHDTHWINLDVLVSLSSIWGRLGWFFVRKTWQWHTRLGWYHDISCKSCIIDCLYLGNAGLGWSYLNIWQNSSANFTERVYECNLLAAETHDPRSWRIREPSNQGWLTGPSFSRPQPRADISFWLACLESGEWEKKPFIHDWRVIQLASSSEHSEHCHYPKQCESKNTFEGPQFQTNTCLKRQDFFWTKKGCRRAGLGCGDCVRTVPPRHSVTPTAETMGDQLAPLPVLILNRMQKSWLAHFNPLKNVRGFSYLNTIWYKFRGGFPNSWPSWLKKKLPPILGSWVTGAGLGAAWIEKGMAAMAHFVHRFTYWEWWCFIDLPIKKY